MVAAARIPLRQIWHHHPAHSNDWHGYGGWERKGIRWDRYVTQLLADALFISNVSRMAPCTEAIIAETAARPARLWRKYQHRGCAEAKEIGEASIRVQRFTGWYNRSVLSLFSSVYGSSPIRSYFYILWHSFKIIFWQALEHRLRIGVLARFVLQPIHHLAVLNLLPTDIQYYLPAISRPIIVILDVYRLPVRPSRNWLSNRWYCQPSAIIVALARIWACAYLLLLTVRDPGNIVDLVGDEAATVAL